MWLTANKLMDDAGTVIKSIVTDKKLVFYGLLLLALHLAGFLFLYKRVPEFDNVPHFWFGYVLSEYSSIGANSIKLQVRLVEEFQRHGWATANHQKVDFLVRLTGFLLIGCLFWEWAELFFSPLIGIRPDSFFAFPITLRSIDGTLDVIVGVIGAAFAFLLKQKRKNKKKM